MGLMSFIELEILDNDFKDICEMHWDIDAKGVFVHTVSAIAKEFKTTSFDISKKVKKSCVAYCKVTKCTQCEEPYIYTNRADFNRQSLDRNFTCQACVEIDRQEQNQQKHSILEEYYQSSMSQSVEIELMNIKDAIYLLSVIKHLASEDLEYLMPYVSSQANLLSPSEEFDIKILRKLANKDILCVSTRSDLSAIEVNDKGQIQYYIDRVSWEIPIDAEKYSHPKFFIAELETKLKSLEWSEEWFDGAKELCQEVALQESLAYLDFVMTEHQFNFSPGDKTILVLSKILEKHSVAQAYNLIWRSVKDAAAYYMRSNIPRAQAANSVVGNMERMLEKYTVNKWEITPYRRNYKIPTSVLSQVLYGTILGTDDGGFHVPVEKII